MQASYSRVSTFLECPFKYRLIYLEKLEPKEDQSANNALYVGSAVHLGIEKKDIEAAVEDYKSHYEILTELNNFEIEKIKAILPKAFEQIPNCEVYEYKLDVPDEYIGYIDGLKKNDDGTYDILDFKCTNNIAGYKNSPQVHIYKYYFEQLTGNKVKDLYYVFIPKATIKLNEDLSNKKEILEDLAAKNIYFELVKYDQYLVDKFINDKNLMAVATKFPKKYNRFCNWCQFKKLCKSNGLDRSELK